MTDRRSHLYQQDNVTNWALTIDKALDHVTILKISTQLVFSQPFDTDFEPVPTQPKDEEPQALVTSPSGIFVLDLPTMPPLTTDYLLPTMPPT